MTPRTMFALVLVAGCGGAPFSAPGDAAATLSAMDPAEASTAASQVVAAPEAGQPAPLAEAAPLDAGDPPDVAPDGGSADAPIDGADSDGPVALLPAFAPPTFTPPSGTVLSGQTTVTIVPPAGFPTNGLIYYATNENGYENSRGDESAPIEGVPILVVQSGTVHAFDWAPGYEYSSVASATYVVGP